MTGRRVPATHERILLFLHCNPPPRRGRAWLKRAARREERRWLKAETETE